MSRYNNFDENEYSAFISDESKIKTDDRDLDELDEFSPENMDENMFIMQDDEL